MSMDLPILKDRNQVYHGEAVTKELIHACHKMAHLYMV